MLTTTSSSKTLINIYMVTKTLMIVKNVTIIVVLIMMLNCLEIREYQKLCSNYKMIVGREKTLSVCYYIMNHRIVIVL